MLLLILIFFIHIEPKFKYLLSDVQKDNKQQQAQKHKTHTHTYKKYNLA